MSTLFDKVWTENELAYFCLGPMSLDNEKIILENLGRLRPGHLLEVLMKKDFTAGGKRKIIEDYKEKVLKLSLGECQNLLDDHVHLLDDLLKISDSINFGLIYNKMRTENQPKAVYRHMIIKFRYNLVVHKIKNENFQPFIGSFRNGKRIWSSNGPVRT